MNVEELDYLGEKYSNKKNPKAGKHIHLKVMCLRKYTLPEKV